MFDFLFLLSNLVINSLIYAFLRNSESKSKSLLDFLFLLKIVFPLINHFS